MRKILLTFLMLIAAMPLWAQSWTKELEKSAKNGDVNSQLIIANAYFKGDGITANKAKAAQWYYKATINNNAEAKQKLYSFYSKELEKFAKGGDAQAQYEVGMDYYSGEGIAKNTETAAKWFHLASTQGHEEAKKMLYSFYSKELEKAAKGGDAQAQYEVGMDYYSGEGIAKNTETAAKWFQLASTQGHEEAKAQYYSFYSKVLENNADKDLEAMYHVGKQYFEGSCGAPQNEKKGFNYLKKANEKGHPKALDVMGSRYTKHLKSAALNWYNGIKNDDAAYALALCYLNGSGVNPDTKYAISLLAMTSDRGHKKSQELFYSIDSEERDKRTSVLVKTPFILTVYSNYDGVILEQYGNVYKSVRTPLTQNDKNEIIGYNSKCQEFIDHFFVIKDVKIKIPDRDDVCYSGDLYVMPALYRQDSYGNSTKVTDSHIYFSERGSLLVAISSSKTVSLPLNQVVSINNIAQLNTIKANNVDYKQAVQQREQEIAEQNEKARREAMEAEQAFLNSGDDAQILARGKDFYIKNDYDNALKYLTKADELGNLEAKYFIALCYYHGSGVDEDESKAVSMLKEITEKGYLPANYTLGIAYENGGGGLTKNNTIAQNCFKKAFPAIKEKAEKGDIHFQYLLGNCYFFGYGTDKDHDKSFVWYKKAAEQGYPAAQYNLGCAYHNGDGVLPNHNLAVEWWRKAAEQGDTDAMGNLGWAYSTGNGVYKNYDEAVKWWRKAAEQGNAFSLNSMGDCYYYGEGVSRDYETAAIYYRKAADKGRAAAQNNLGHCYSNGKGVTQSDSEAIKWWRKAAEQGNVDAQGNLGWAYYHGRGVKQSHSQSINWIRKAAEQGSAWAQCWLGWRYYKGEGVAKSKSTAKIWFQKAADQGYEDAKDVLRRNY